MKKKISMKKLMLTILAVSMLLFMFAGCGNQEADVIRVGMLKGPTGIGATYLMEQAQNGDSENQYEFFIYSSPTEITAQIINGELDIAAVPTNNASVIYNQNNGSIKVAAVNTMGTLYVLENGDTINSIEDLKGKKIMVSGQGATPEYALKYILSANGIDPDQDVTIEYVAEHAELATLLASGNADIGLLPEPNVTSVLINNPDCRIALNLNDEWEKAAELNGESGALTMGCVIVQKDFAENYKDSVDKFLEEYKESIEYVNNNIEEAAQLCEKFEIIPKAAVAQKAIPTCNIVYLDGEEMIDAMEGYLEILYNYNPASIGGTLVGEELYYQK